jgi:endonuclease-3
MEVQSDKDALSLRAFGRLVLDWKDAHPWHAEENPFWKLVAEVLLVRTTREAVKRVFSELKQRFPSAEALASGRREDVEAVVAEVGLKARGRALIEAARLFSKGLPTLSEVSRLPYVGPYVLSAYKLYALSEPAFPLDSTVARVAYRFLKGEEPPKRRSKSRKGGEPYKDPFLTRIARELEEGSDPEELKGIHQGVLYVGWKWCRSTPKCDLCPVRGACAFRAS